MSDVIRVYLSRQDLVAIIASGVLTMPRADKLQDQLDAHDRHERERQERWAAEDKRRAERAAGFKLTEVQAGMLAAFRAGRGAFSRPRKTLSGKWYWVHTRSMGGSRARLWHRLEEEGLLERGGRKVSAAGLERLEAWEAKHGQFPFD